MSTRTDWKGAALVIFSWALLGLAACGGSGAATSGLAKRAFVSDDVDGTLHIEDALRDIESPHTIGTGSQPGLMRLSPDKSITLVFNAGSVTLSAVMNSTETVLDSISLPGPSTDYVLADDTLGFAAVPNSANTPCTPRCVEVLNLATTTTATTFEITGTIKADTTGQPLNAATTLVLSPDHSKLLVFGGPAEHIDTLIVIDTATAQTTPATAATQLGGFDRPVSAVFSADSTKAYVLNCGPECGGTTASVAVLDMTVSPPVPITNVPVPAASVALLSGNIVFVAGTPSGTPGSLAGRLSMLDATALTLTGSVPISDGYHDLMELGSNNKLLIGAITCSAGCLTVFDTSNNQAAVDPITGNVTGIAPISARSVVYVVEDVAAGSYHCQSLSPCLGKLRIYDTTASVPTFTPTQIDVVGKAVDVKYVDK